MTDRYAPAALQAFAAEMFQRAGLAEGRAVSMARIFVEADLLGFSTHGLARVPINLAWLRDGETRRDGEPRVVSDRPGAFCWDAALLPGPWVLERAIAELVGRARTNGVAAATLQRCTHVACLAAYLVPVIESGLVGILVVSTPDERFISPFGAREAVFSNNPIAFCAPTSGAPLLFDVSMAVTAGGRIARAAREGKRLPEACLKTAGGVATDDPLAMDADPPATVMPIGGLGHGHKGYALTLMTEILSQALGGHGRLEAAGEGEANSVFVELLDPDAFGQRSAYLAEADHLVALCRSATPDDPDVPVRLPGMRAWAQRERALADGVELYDGVFDALLIWADRLDVVPPRPV